MRCSFVSSVVVAMVGVGCSSPPDVTSRQLAIEGDACPAEWYAAAPPDPDWGFPPTLGDMLPISYGNIENVTGIFGVPVAQLQSMLPSGVTAFELLPGSGLGGLAVTVANNREISGGMEPYKELILSIPVYDTSLYEGYLPIFLVSMVVTTEQARWGGVTGWGMPKILGNTHCQQVPPKGFKCMASADDELILKLEIQPTSVTATPTSHLVFLSVKDDYLVRTRSDVTGDEYAYGPGRATIKLGHHPIAEQLRSLGLESAPAMAASWAPHVTNQLDRGYCTPLP